MGRLLDALSAKTQTAARAIPAIRAIPEPTNSRIAGIAEGAAPKNAPLPLLAVLRAEGLPDELLGKDDATPEQLALLGADGLRTYAHALHREAIMATGLLPPGFVQVVHCEGCGPVCLPEGHAERLAACPWCHHRRAGVKFLRPPVRCGDCLHYLPDPLNPESGTGTCKAGHGARWPMQAHRCAHMQPTSSLLISFSAEG